MIIIISKLIKKDNQLLRDGSILSGASKDKTIINMQTDKGNFSYHGFEPSPSIDIKDYSDNSDMLLAIENWNDRF